MLNEFTTDECVWVYQDAGVPELVRAQANDNVIDYGIYSRFYVASPYATISSRWPATCCKNGIPVGGDGPTAISQEEIDQLVREAKALRGLSYYNVIDLWGRGVVAWDNDGFGRRPPEAESRAALYDKVVEDPDRPLSAGLGPTTARAWSTAASERMPLKPSFAVTTSIPRCGQAFRAMTNAGNVHRT